MSNKAARGTKRLCDSCGSKFYDLNRDPIVCPMCGTVFELERVLQKIDHLAESDDTDDLLPVGGPEMVSLDEVAAAEGEDIPDLDDGALDDDAGIADAGDDDAFLEEEDEGNQDMTGFIGGGGAKKPDDEI